MTEIYLALFESLRSMFWNLEGLRMLSSAIEAPRFFDIFLDFLLFLLLRLVLRRP